MTLYFSRLTLNRFAPAQALRSLIDPSDPNRAADAHHKLMWTVFSDARDRERDFLWRYDGKGQFFTLSRRPPQPSDLFAPHAVKKFAPALSIGDRLQFVLRANATTSADAQGEVRPDGKNRGRHDVVMAALKPIPAAERAALRDQVAQTAATDWMTRKGQGAGFDLNQVTVDAYSQIAIGMPSRKNPRQFGVLDMTGQLTITDPEAFALAYPNGFGRAKAWGCGLMLIRRAGG